jgi:hypothetical protein
LHQPTLTTQLLHQLLRPALDAPNSFGMSGTSFWVTLAVLFGLRGDVIDDHLRGIGWTPFASTLFHKP